MVDCCNPFCFLLLLQSQPPATPLCSYLNTKIIMIIRSTFPEDYIFEMMCVWGIKLTTIMIDHHGMLKPSFDSMLCLLCSLMMMTDNRRTDKTSCIMAGWSLMVVVVVVWYQNSYYYSITSLHDGGSLDYTTYQASGQAAFLIWLTD